jgi:P pilus assembly chaperone PapD
MRRFLTPLTLLSVIAASSLAAQVQVNNADIWLSASQPTATFTVSNEGTDATQFTLTDGDWDRAPNGDNRFFPAGSTPSSCERALTVFPRQLRLAGGTTQTVRVAVNPDSLPPRACWSIIFVESEAGTGTTASASIRYVARIGVKVYFTPAQTVTLAEVVDFVQAPKVAPTDSDAVDFTVRNTGTRPVSLHGSVELRRQDNFVVQRVLVDAIPVLPGATRTIHTAFTKPLPGTYVALAVFDYGDSEDLAAQAPVEIR